MIKLNKFVMQIGKYSKTFYRRRPVQQVKEVHP